MPIIKNGAVISDEWVWVDDDIDAPLPQIAIFPLSSVIEGDERLAEYSGKLGLFIENDVKLREYSDVIARADLVVLHLPVFTDGRAYSQARILRNTLNFEKEMRIKGDVLPDQAAYLKACGFDSFDIEGAFDAEVWEKALRMISSSYQRSYDRKAEHRQL